MDLKCPSCSASGADLMGYEVRGVYDGVLFWACHKCGNAWARNGFQGKRAELAEQYAATYRIGRDG